MNERTWVPTRGPVRLIAGALAGLVLVGACTNAKTTHATTGATASTQPDHPTTSAQPVKGGTLVLGAAQEPGCTDWFASCANSSWGRDTMGSQTLPRAFDFVDGQYRASPLLADEPTVVAGPPQKVTYRINPRAVWSDGQPITSADFKYTAEQARPAGTTVAAAVDTVDATDPHTAVVTFKNPTPGWRDGFLFIVPQHLLEGKDRGAEMRNGYSFSGGPWVIEHWTRGQEIKLVPNTAYWGAKPNLDAVVFKVITDSTAYLAAYKTGQLDMAFVQGAQPEVAELESLPGTHFEASVGFAFEFVMFNTLKPPLDSKAVRQALAYATDRQAIVTQLSGPIQPDLTPAQAFMSPSNRHWYSEPFKKYERNLAKVSQLMTSDGWAKGGDGVWAKGGTRATVELNTTSGNHRRELTEQILQSQWKDAGFDATVKNTVATQLFGESLPKGVFQAAIFSVTPPSPDPDECGMFCSKNIPTEATGFKGGDVSRISSPALDTTWAGVAIEVDDGARLQLVRQAQQALAEEVPVLPISPVLDIVVYNSAKVGGVKPSPTGAFANLAAWYCRAGSC